MYVGIVLYNPIIEIVRNNINKITKSNVIDKIILIDNHSKNINEKRLIASTTKIMTT